MLRILSILAAVALLFYALYWRSLPPPKRRQHLYVLMIAAFLGVLLFLTLTGRLHGLIALGAALLPFLRHLLFVVKWLPFVRKWLARRRGAEPTPPVASVMTRSDALKILGLEEGATEEQIRQAHRALMQKLHPDHGGNDFLAAQLNQARDVLLGK